MLQNIVDLLSFNCLVKVTIIGGEEFTFTALVNFLDRILFRNLEIVI